MSENLQPNASGINKLISKQDEQMYDECVITYLNMKGAREIENKFRLYVKVSYFYCKLLVHFKLSLYLIY